MICTAQCSALTAHTLTIYTQRKIWFVLAETLFLLEITSHQFDFHSTVKEHILKEHVPVKCSHLFHLVNPLTLQKLKQINNFSNIKTAVLICSWKFQNCSWIWISLHLWINSFLQLLTFTCSFSGKSWYKHTHPKT